MKRLLLFAVLLISVSAFGQTTPTLPAGSIQVQAYKNPNGKNYVGNAAKKFEVIALQRSLDSLTSVIRDSINVRLRLTGGFMSGYIRFDEGNANKGLFWNKNSDGAKIFFESSGDVDGTSNMIFETSDNIIDAGGPTEGFIFRKTGLGDITPSGPMDLLKFNPTQFKYKTFDVYHSGNFDPSNKISVSEKGSNNGVASLDAGGKVPASQLPTGAQVYKGTWNASTNTPILSDGIGTSGWVYSTSAAGTQNLGSGNISFLVGDEVIYNGTIWEKKPSASTVVSVNGQMGAVNLTTTNINEGANLYYTEGRVSSNSNVSANTAARHSAVTLGTANGLSLSAQMLSLGLSSASSTGALSQADWIIFNSKQAAGSYALTSGANTSGLWPISVSGNAATSTNSGQWNGIQNDFGSYGTNIGSIIGYDLTSSKAQPYEISTIKTALGIPSGGETLQSVSDRGNIIETPIPTLRLKTNQGSGKEFRLSAGYFDSTSLSIIDVTAGNADRLHISTSGNIGVGTATPSYKLDVNGTGNFSGNVTAPIFIGNATLTGTPTAPTATAGTNTTQVATTAFVQAALSSGISSGTPTIVMGSSTTVGTGATISIAGNNVDGVITLTTGTSITTGGTVFTVTFGGGLSYPTTSIPIVQNNVISGTSNVLLAVQSQNSNSWSVMSGAMPGPGLNASTTYKWNYHVGGY